MILTLVTWKSGIYQSQVSPLPFCQPSCRNAFIPLLSGRRGTEEYSRLFCVCEVLEMGPMFHH